MTHRLWLSVSLVLNATLLTATFVVLHRRSNPPALATLSPAATAAPVPQPPDPSPSTTRPPSPGRQRRSIVDRLRALGVPNELLALVARVDFEVQWDRRFEQCRGDAARLAATQLEMNMSKDAAMRAALGEEGFRQWDQHSMLWEAMSTAVDVTPLEAEAIYRLKKKLQQSQFAVEQARLKGTMDDAQINEAYDRAYADYYTNLKAVLGDERYATSQQLDAAFLAENLRHELAAAHPSEAQFQELFQIEQAWKQSRSELEHQFQDHPAAPEYLEKLKALDEAHNLEYQRVLGADAFGHWQKEQDPAYAQMKRYANLWGLDDAKIEHVYAVLKEFQATASRFQAQARDLAAQGQAGDPSALQQNLQMLAAQTEKTLLNELGPVSLGKLQRNRVLPFTKTPPSSRGPF